MSHSVKITNHVRTSVTPQCGQLSLQRWVACDERAAEVGGV